MQEQRYVGIHEDQNGGMTDTGQIIRDGWAFGLIGEDETCKGWMPHEIDALWTRVNAEWEKFGHHVSAMPIALRARYLRIQSEALDRAKAAGWTSSDMQASLG